MAVAVALGETHVIEETKNWLEREGICVDAFEAKGASLMSSGFDAKTRSKDTIVVKHLPGDVKGVSVADELRERFERYGDVKRFCLAPAKTVCVVQFGSEKEAAKAFNKVNFSRYHHVPLFLEWAPEGVFKSKAAPAQAANPNAAEGKKKKEVEGGEQEVEETKAKSAIAAAAEADVAEEDANAPRATLFVKNLNFTSTEESLHQVFASCGGYRLVSIMKKKSVDAKKEGLSMGYGFVEFDTLQNAQECLKLRQNCVLDGHKLQLQLSEGGRSGQSATARKTKQEAERDAARALKGNKGLPPLSNKLCIRNVAFEANKRELKQLFGAFGTITSLRIPKKADRSGGHRGFAFIDYLTKTEAVQAFEKLQHTHFYGRRLVIEPAEKESMSVEEITALQTVKEDKKESGETEAKKRQKQAEINMLD